VNPDEIWRIRATSTSDEPPGAIVIDYAFERVYVKESLASVVEKVGGVRPLKKFTLARFGAALWFQPCGLGGAAALQSSKGFKHHQDINVASGWMQESERYSP
jgi:hypothetical protein